VVRIGKKRAKEHHLLRPLYEACQERTTEEGNMPFVHATGWHRLDPILASGNLGVFHCPVFKENLCYLFYGRLAFRLEPNDSIPDQISQAPIILVFKPTSMPVIRRVLPFDSGGYISMFRQAMPVENNLDELNLSDIDHADALLDLYWKSREAYFFFDYASGLFPEAQFQSNFATANYFSLLQKRNVDKNVDDRRGSIELSADQPVPVTSETLVGIIVPFNSLRNKRLVELAKNGVAVKGYPYFGESAIELTTLLRHEVYKLFCEMQLLKPGYGG
jgi:hypothetical protein